MMDVAPGLYSSQGIQMRYESGLFKGKIEHRLAVHIVRSTGFEK